MIQFDLIIDGKRKTFSGPAHWDEIKTKKQFRTLFRLSRISSVYPPARYAVLFILFNIPKKYQRYLVIDDETDEEMIISIDALMNQTASIWDKLEAPKKIFFYQDLRILWKRFRGPGNDFSEMTFGQFIFADRFFEQLHTTKNYKKTSRLFLGSLFCEHGKTFDSDRIESIAQWTRLIPPDVREAIIFNYAGLRKKLSQNFKEVFNSGGNKDKSKQQDAMAAGWLDVAINLAGDDLGKLHEYEKGKLFLVMKIIRNAIIRADEMEAKYGKKNK